MFDASLIPVYGPKLANWSLPRDNVTSYAINKGLYATCFASSGTAVIHRVESYFMLI